MTSSAVTADKEVFELHLSLSLEMYYLLLISLGRYVNFFNSLIVLMFSLLRYSKHTLYNFVSSQSETELTVVCRTLPFFLKLFARLTNFTSLLHAQK